MTYLAGLLDLETPSERHEEESKLIARLLEAWSEENDVDLRGFKSATFRSEAQARGAEPDECYPISPKLEDAPPQIAIEVIVSSPLVDKLAVYAGLGVPEVWVWHSTSHHLAIHRLVGQRYEAVSTSPRLPGLDLALSSRSCAAARTRPRSSSHIAPHCAANAASAPALTRYTQTHHSHAPVAIARLIHA